MRGIKGISSHRSSTQHYDALHGVCTCYSEHFFYFCLNFETQVRNVVRCELICHLIHVIDACVDTHMFVCITSARERRLQPNT